MIKTGYRIKMCMCSICIGPGVLKGGPWLWTHQRHIRGWPMDGGGGVKEGEEWVRLQAGLKSLVGQ